MSRGIRDVVHEMGPGWLVKETIVVGSEPVEVDNRVLYAMALVLDALSQRQSMGTAAKFPSYAPADALPLIGRDRLIIRGPDESQANYELRLQRYLDDHRVRGNPWALMEQVRGYLSPHAVRCRTVDEHGNWRTIDRDGTRTVNKATAWNWDGSPLTQAWGRFWLIIQPTIGGEPWTPGPDWGDPTLWGGAWGTPGYTWGSTATPNEVSAIRSLVKVWKRAGVKCPYVLIVFNDTALAPTLMAPPLPNGTWANYSKNSGGTQVPARSSEAIYWLVQ